MNNGNEEGSGELSGQAGRSRARRHPVALVVTILVILGGLVGPPALSTPTGAVPVGAELRVDWGYQLMAPLANVLDSLSLMTVGQHIAFLVTLIVVFLVWRLFRRRERRGWLRRLGIELGVALLSLAGLLTFYAYGAIGPRPMAYLAVDDPHVLVLDVHSHTEHSHDARPGFTVADNRAWHAAAGFDAAYVSDHRTWDGWLEAAESNPARAGQGMVLLPALEIHFALKYASVLGDPWRYRPAVDGRHLIPDSLYAVWNRGGPRPTLVLTIPEELDSIPRSTPDSIGYVAIEVSDGAPRGLSQARRDRALILRMADSLDLALVAASNNHGWGRTAAAWTLMSVPGWPDMTPEELDTAIEDRLHTERREASRVVERRSPWLGETPAPLTLTAPAVAWQMFGGMGFGERVSWLVWAWALALLVPAVRRR